MARDLFDRDRIADYGRRGFKGGLNTLGGFQKFLLRGNVVDLAVGVIIGAAFNGVVQALVKDLITPLIGLFVQKQNLSNLTTTYHQQIFAYGDFLNVVLSFILTAAVVYFLVVKPINALHDRYDRLRPKKEEAPTTRDCPFCLSSVPLKATRCAYCTAQLPPADETPAQAATAR
ncbi:large conductance mechanosensitive channel protein MscL [Dictyobacter aurantiacus]|uniref:Large-conductance mechanosensitive channel n=1 Tax=Dictyobacter aurantiacus TaxID=1936993 RepID=A0A401ZAZ7_9CHLR|nr:large conductance mechanosensitive channel protein MscL [Dictyobacter aurantiacus]GCE04012.1 large-conductance mechanosensitive channel [Dictyobacter aurantiacus]